MALSMVRSRAGLTILPRSRGGFDGRYLFCFFPGKINPPMRRMHIATFDESRSGGGLWNTVVLEDARGSEAFHS